MGAPVPRQATTHLTWAFWVLLEESVVSRQFISRLRRIVAAQLAAREPRLIRATVGSEHCIRQFSESGRRVAAWGIVMASTWTPLAAQPAFNVSTMLLLTDGTVMAHDSGSINWWRLSPEGSGNYVKGIWSNLAPMHHTRLYFASAVLTDGRVFVAGGEYSNAGGDTTTAEIYDPLFDTWTEIAAPAGWTKIGDAPCTVLPDGRVLVGQIDGQGSAVYDPVANQWVAAGLKGDASSEESWVLLGDRSVLTCQCTAHPGAEKYLPATNEWVSAGRTPQDLVEAASIEIGAGILLPDGRALFIGATPHTALYTAPVNPSQAGTWAAGPDIPNDASGRTCGAKDAPACLMVNGHVLMTVGPVDGVSGDYLSPTYFYEFDGQTLIRVADPPNAGGPPFVGRMTLLPTGEILYAAGSQALYAYSAPGVGDNGWRPTISSVPGVIQAGATFALAGAQLNGLSQAVGYGDDASAATNYPLVRLEKVSGAVYYCRTSGHSTMGVATGAALETTTCTVPAVVPAGSYQLRVIANGIPSNPVSVTVAPFASPRIEWPALWTWVIGSFADGPLWVIGPHGPIPVDPWGPDIQRSVRDTIKSVVSGLRLLQKMGIQVDGKRLTQAQQAPPERDPGLAHAPKPESLSTRSTSAPSRSKWTKNRGKPSRPKTRTRRKAKSQPR